MQTWRNKDSSTYPKSLGRAIIFILLFNKMSYDFFFPSPHDMRYLVITLTNVGFDFFSLSLITSRDQRHFLIVASRSKAPVEADLVKLLAPTSQAIQGIQSFREKNRTSPLFNHLSAISESIPALGWVTVAPAPGPYIKEMNDAGQFYTNRVLKDWKDK